MVVELSCWAGVDGAMWASRFGVLGFYGLGFRVFQGFRGLGFRV